MVNSIDINCDMGEGMPDDAQLMPFISSANIACGFHAGDAETIRRTIELALKHHVCIGAHVSFHDRENFGRTEISMPADEIRNLVIEQLAIMRKMARSFGVKIRHVKPHGALYNMS